MTRTLSALLLATAVLLTGCGASSTPVQMEVEDCDAEDYANREAECGFVKSRKTTTTKHRTTTRRTVRH